MPPPLSAPSTACPLTCLPPPLLSSPTPTCPLTCLPPPLPAPTPQMSPPPALLAVDLLTATGLVEAARQHGPRHALSVLPAGAVLNFHMAPGGATTWIHLVEGQLVRQAGRGRG